VREKMKNAARFLPLTLLTVLAVASCAKKAPSAHLLPRHDPREPASWRLKLDELDRLAR